MATCGYNIAKWSKIGDLGMTFNVPNYRKMWKTISDLFYKKTYKNT